MERLRTFISIDIDEPTVVNELTKLQGELKSADPAIKLVEPQNIHLTLRFLGEIDVGLVEGVKDVLNKVKFKPFEMELGGVGCFPNMNRPRVIWVGLLKGVEEVRRLHEDIERGLRGLGFRPDPKGFEPHITIARVKRLNRELVNKLMEVRDLVFGKILVKAIKLKKSTLTPRGPIYESLFERRAVSEGVG